MRSAKIIRAELAQLRAEGKTEAKRLDTGDPAVWASGQVARDALYQRECDLCAELAQADPSILRGVGLPFDDGSVS